MFALTGITVFGCTGVCATMLVRMCVCVCYLCMCVNCINWHCSLEGLLVCVLRDRMGANLCIVFYLLMCIMCICVTYVCNTHTCIHTHTHHVTSYTYVL